jgi:hypothetical protein
VNPITDLALAWRGLAMTVAGKREAASQFNPTRAGLVIALGWFLLAIMLSAAAQSAAVGMPSLAQLAIGVLIQAVTVAALALVTAQSFHFLRLGLPMTAIFVPIVYFMALVQVLAIPLSLIGPNAQLIAVFGLGVLIWRAGVVLANMRNGVAIAFALLCLMVLVVVPNALYIVFFLSIPSPA